VNIESWCSSLQTFEKNEDGSEGAYISLYRELENSTIPLIFSELGCSQILFNRDNHLGTILENQRRARDWRQVNVVETKMANQFSGYIAYAYDGPVDFRMTNGGPWDGIHPLTFNLDMENYLQALTNTSATLPPPTETTTVPPTCESVKKFLDYCCNLDLMDVEDMPSYFTVPARSLDNRTYPVVSSTDDGMGILVNNEGRLAHDIASRGVVALMGVCTIIFLVRRRWNKKTKHVDEAETVVNIGPAQASYNTFA
jgi:hypothetical protein